MALYTMLNFLRKNNLHTSDDALPSAALSHPPCLGIRSALGRHARILPALRSLLCPYNCIPIFPPTSSYLLLLQTIRIPFGRQRRLRLRGRARRFYFVHNDAMVNACRQQHEQQRAPTHCVKNLLPPTYHGTSSPFIFYFLPNCRYTLLPPCVAVGWVQDGSADGRYSHHARGVRCFGALEQRRTTALPLPPYLITYNAHVSLSPTIALLLRVRRTLLPTRLLGSFSPDGTFYALALPPAR